MGFFSKLFRRDRNNKNLDLLEDAYQDFKVQSAILTPEVDEGRKCRDCKSNLHPNFPYVRCDECRAKHRELTKRLYQERLDSGICTRCSSPAEDGSTMCIKCLELNVIRNREARARKANHA